LPKRIGPGLSEAQRHSYRVNRDRGLIVRVHNALCLPCIRMAVGQLKSCSHDHTHMTIMCPNAALSAVKARGQRAALIGG
jgi:hypothetical protein